MDTNLPYQDSVDGATHLPETMLPKSQRTCLRNSPCLQQGCMTCSTPTNHICDLNAALDAINSPTTNPITTTKPSQPPPNHLIVHLNDVFELDTTMKQYTHATTSDPEFVIYDCSYLCTACNHAMQVLNSNTALLPVICQFQTPQTGVASPTISSTRNI